MPVRATAVALRQGLRRGSQFAGDVVGLEGRWHQRRVAVAVRVRFRTRLFVSACQSRLLRLCTKSERYTALEKTHRSENNTWLSATREVQRSPPKCLRDKPKLAGPTAAENGVDPGRWRRECPPPAYR